MKLILLCICLAATDVIAKTIKVSPNGMDLKHAVNNAAAGDTILVSKGTYKPGNVIIEKSITILGEGMPVLDGEKKHEIFTVHANGLTISGLKFINTGVSSINDPAAVKVLDSKNIVIVGNQFENAFFAVHFSNSSYSKIIGNEIKANAETEYQIGNGVHLWKCHHITVSDNTIRGHRDGIYFEFVTNSFISGNISQGNKRYGLHFMFSHDDEYENNKFIDNGAGVAVMYTARVTMTGNTFEKNWGSSAYGLLLKDIRDSSVSGNIFKANSVGIFMEGSSRIRFQENTFSQNGYAVKLQASCDDNVFRRNNFSGNTFDIATNGTLILNKIESNYWDRYEGYDLNNDKVGDVPYRPVSMYSMIVEQVPTAVLLWRSFLVMLIDNAEKAIPVITPENLKDDSPSMRPYDFN